MKYVIFALLFALFGAVFALQNATAVTVSFAVWSFQTSLVLVILGSAIVGALIVLLLAAPMQMRLRWMADKAVRHAAELESKLQAQATAHAIGSVQPAAATDGNAAEANKSDDGKGMRTNGI